VKHFKTNLVRCDVLTGCYHWGAGLAVTGRICDIGQKVLQSFIEQKVAAATVTATFSTLSHSSRRSLL